MKVTSVHHWPFFFFLVLPPFPPEKDDWFYQRHLHKSHLHIAVKYVFMAKIHIAHDIKPKFYEIIYNNNFSRGNRNWKCSITEIFGVNTTFSFDFWVSDKNISHVYEIFINLKRSKAYSKYYYYYYYYF